MPVRRSDLVVTGRLLAAALAAALLAGCSVVGDREPPSGEPSFYRSLAKPGAELDAGAAQSMISGYRHNNGLTPVVLDPQLMQLAQEQARAMAARDTLDHNVGRPFSERIKTSGFDAKIAAENISAGYHTIAEAFSGWRDSPPHRANMLLKGASHMGIAAVYAPGSKYKVFWSLILAAPDDRPTATGRRPAGVAGPPLPQ
jgi:Cysteine-rich secretory protein family